ncbi:MAG TPA: 2,5-diamino-6-(ribosylamino)-4(3H)-pyrimidinone 5'-phosphate reductase [Candidatus Nitrosotenuis sp.]|nr:2,5-diamino-6-(ribosylamino)-4(3H)-pyrimidinone 5'-phosphate reductase [Candidatus Nitrosotenuis sp.]
MAISRPRIILSAAMSIDGKIATKTGDSGLSSRQDKIRVHRLRAKADAIIVGIRTVSVDNPLLTVRYARGKNPTRIVLDSFGRILPSSRIIKTANKVPTIIAVSKKATKKNLAKLARYPVKILIAGQNKVELKKLLNTLHKQKIKTVLLEGGGTLNWEFIRQGLVDELVVTVTPYIVGGKDAITLVEGNGFSKILHSPKLRLYKIARQNNEIVLHYS